MKDKLSVLKSVFGHDGFRPLQEEAVDTILQGRDLLMILPTGGGKSLCYQLPSLLMEGVSIVISPLLALMHDQVTALKAQGIAAEMISSMQDAEEIEAIYQKLFSGQLKLLYVAPERFKSGRFIDMLQQLRINFFVIDEAHCVSEWGHEFRDDYRRLSFLRQTFPGVGIAAFTATATQKVAEDIVTNLQLRDPARVRGAIFRENMLVSVEYRQKDGRQQLLQFLSSHKDEQGIIYTFTRKAAETLALFLQGKGVKARAYHAGLDAAERSEVYHDFVHDEIEIVVATVAFGMGIDKSNIRFVVHMSMPKTIENYYQEIGRAGRDGLASEVLLLFSVADMMQRKELINQLPDSPYKEHSYAQLNAMIRYADSESCRHERIAAYFDDTIDACASQCDNCLNPEQPKVDITTEAQMFLSAVYRSEQRFGQAYIIDLLRGSKSQKLEDNGHHRLSVYGVGKERSQAQWYVIGERLLEVGALNRGEYQALVIEPLGLDILKKKATLDVRESRMRVKRTSRYSADEGVHSETFEALRALRSTIAHEEEVPAYVVFNDKTLKEMAEALPQTREEMLQVGGIGEKKYDRYGEEFLGLCRQLKGQG